jgi:hypothetical protein
MPKKPKTKAEFVEWARLRYPQIAERLNGIDDTDEAYDVVMEFTREAAEDLIERIQAKRPVD